MDISLTPADVLRQARTVLVQRGWCQNKLNTPDGRVCARGALMAAAGIDLNSDGWWANSYLITVAALAEDALEEVVRRDLGERHVPTWNDRESTTAEDVLLLMKVAAEEWDEQHGTVAA